MDFSTWTKEDFEAMDARRADVFTPTPEEIAQQQAEHLQYNIALVQSILTQYEIPFTGEETDFTQLWQWYLLGGPTGLSLPMNEWIGDDARLQEFTQEKIANENTLEAFMQFVIQYQ